MLRVGLLLWHMLLSRRGSSGCVNDKGAWGHRQHHTDCLPTQLHEAIEVTAPPTVQAIIRGYFNQCLAQSVTQMYTALTAGSRGLLAGCLTRVCQMQEHAGVRAAPAHLGLKT